MTISKTEKSRRAATRAANVAKKNDPVQGVDHIVAEAISSGAASRAPDSVVSPAIRSAKEIPDTGVVTVACKMPTGLLLRVFMETTDHEQVMGGGTRPVKVFRPAGDQVRIQGYAVPPNKRPKYLITNSNYALTENVDAAFFKRWWIQNETSELVKSGLIFCMARKDEAEAKAETREGLMNGLEPMSQGKDPRAGKTANPNLEDILPANTKQKTA